VPQTRVGGTNSQNPLRDTKVKETHAGDKLSTWTSTYKTGSVRIRQRAQHALGAALPKVNSTGLRTKWARKDAG